MLRYCVLFLLGLCCIALIESGQQAMYLGSIAIVVAILVSLILWTAIGSKFLQSRRSSGTTVSLLRASFILVLGVFWGSLSVVIWWQTTPNYVSKPMVTEIKGSICSIPSSLASAGRSNSRIGFIFCASSIDGKNIPFFVANRIKLSLYRATPNQLVQLRAGSFWRLKAKLRPVHGRRNPRGFDYEKWLVSEGYIATGYVKNIVAREAGMTVNSYFHSVRQKVFEHLNTVIPEGQNKGMLLALSMGERRSISSQQWQVLKGSGTSHLLAISGLHIGIAALWSYYACFFIVARIRWITDKIPAQTIAQIGSLVGAVSITLLSGLGYPAQRALIMLIVYLTTRWSGRHLSLANIYAVSLVIITVIQPFAVLTISFWLSALAVGIIILLLSYRSETNGKLVKFKAWLRINWYLFVALMPITWAVFDSISSVGFVANLILIPLTSFVTTPLVYIGLLTMLISDRLASVFFYLADLAIGLTYAIQSFLAENNVFGTISSLPVGAIFLSLLAVVIILLPRKMPAKTLILPIMFITAATLYSGKTNNRFKMVVFDIGQGLAVYLSAGDKNMLFDTGYGNSSYSMAESEILPYLAREGIDHIDVMVVSHADSDHAGGVKSILNNLPVKHIYTGEPIDFKSSSCHVQNSWRWQDVKFQFLNHLGDLPRKGNNSSCVLQISMPKQLRPAGILTTSTSDAIGTAERRDSEYRILLTGDIEKQAENRLLKLGLRPVDILIAPHHGSLTSSTEKFIKAVHPKRVIFSAGYDNQWHFPKKVVVERYSKIGAQSLTTFERGAISVVVNEKGEFNVRTERDISRHFWQF